MDQAFELCPHGCGGAILVRVWKQECGTAMEKQGPGWTAPEGPGLRSPLTSELHQCPCEQREIATKQVENVENTSIF